MGQRDRAALHNAAQAHQFVQRARELTRQQVKPEHFEPMLEKARSKLAEARRAADDAQDYIERANLRLLSHDLDEETWLAEVLAPFVLAEMVAEVEQALQRAEQVRCPYTAVRMFVTAGFLAGVSEDNLFVEVAFPDDPAIRRQLIDQGLARARHIHYDVADELQHLPDETRGSVPELGDVERKLVSAEPGAAANSSKP